MNDPQLIEVRELAVPVLFVAGVDPLFVLKIFLVQEWSGARSHHATEIITILLERWAGVDHNPWACDSFQKRCLGLREVELNCEIVDSLHAGQRWEQAPRDDCGAFWRFDNALECRHYIIGRERVAVMVRDTLPETEGVG